MTSSPLWLEDERATLGFGSDMAARLSAEVVHLHGPLGAGKTTFVRGVLRGLGYAGFVKSPTYTLVEEYEICGLAVYHWDLYRISDPAEMEFVGVDDLMREGSLRFVEWPERGGIALPRPDISVHIDVVNDGRKLWMTDHRVSQATS